MSRKRAAQKGTSATAQNSTNVRRQAKERLKPSVLEELWSIWRADPRVPSLESRRSWAISRNVSSRLVDGWFLRRRTCAKKAGQAIPDGSYHLLPEPSITLKEESTTVVKPEFDTVLDLPSDDTFVDDTLVYPPDIDYPDDVDASSDTVYHGDMAVESKGSDTPAYTETPFPEQYFQPKSSSANLDVAQDYCNEDVLLFEHFSFPICSQGRGNPSDFTCVLCSSESTQDAMQFDASPTMDSPVPYPCLGFYPASVLELSAIPFLFRTPTAVPPDSAPSHQNTDSWTIVEVELERLVNDGQLDFSFLDDPHLVSIELID